MKTTGKIYSTFVSAILFLVSLNSYSQSFAAGGYQGGSHGSGGVLSNIEEIQMLNDDFHISVFPNPFSESTQLKVELKQNSRLKLEIFDLRGRKIKTLQKSQNFTSGVQLFNWKGDNNMSSDVPKGIYYCRIEINDNTNYKKLIKY